MDVSFQTPNYCFVVTFNNSECAKRIAQNMPIDAKINTWDGGVYFKVGIGFCTAQKTGSVAPGDVVYWPEGSCIGVFFGSGPMKIGEGVLHADDLVLIGTTQVDAGGFSSIKSGDDIRVVAMEEKKTSSPASVVDPGPNPDRKLSQEEIDVLVQQLLAQKKKEQQGG